MGHRTGLALDPRLPEPLYRQIFDQIVSRIQSGAFPGGHKLPPTRALASEIGTHRNTVVRAYEDLENAGFVTSAVGRGTFVVPEPPPPPARPAPAEAKLPWPSLISQFAVGDLVDRFDRLQASYTEEPDAHINLARLQPSTDLLPDDLLRRCMEHVLRTLGPRALGYGPREGLLRLRGVIADDLHRQGVPASAEDILITSGSQQALDLVARALVNPGDTFLVDSVTYGGASNVLRSAGARLVAIPSDDDGPSLTALRAQPRDGLKGLYVMPNCQNPTGISLSQQRREALIAWSHAARVPLIEDDYGADMNLEETPMLPALRALDGDVIYVGTFSKKLIPALRLGFILCPAPLRPILVSLKHTLDLGASALIQHALAEFLERGYMRAHLGRVLPEYRARRDALERALRAQLPSSMTWQHPPHGVLLWLPLPPPLSSEAVFVEARRRGVLVSPSALFSVDARHRQGVRLTFCAEPPERLVEGARRLAEAIGTVRRGGA